MLQVGVVGTTSEHMGEMSIDGYGWGKKST